MADLLSRSVVKIHPMGAAVVSIPPGRVQAAVRQSKNCFLSGSSRASSCSYQSFSFRHLPLPLSICLHAPCELQQLYESLGLNPTTHWRHNFEPPVSLAWSIDTAVPRAGTRILIEAFHVVVGRAAGAVALRGTWASSLSPIHAGACSRCISTEYRLCHSTLKLRQSPKLRSGLPCIQRN